jgi:hypothetical protein
MGLINDHHAVSIRRSPADLGIDVTPIPIARVAAGCAGHFARAGDTALPGKRPPIDGPDHEDPSRHAVRVHGCVPAGRRAGP